MRIAQLAAHIAGTLLIVAARIERRWVGPNALPDPEPRRWAAFSRQMVSCIDFLPTPAEIAALDLAHKLDLDLALCQRHQRRPVYLMAGEDMPPDSRHIVRLSRPLVSDETA